MRLRKLLPLFIISSVYSQFVISEQARHNDIYNPREEVEYGYHAKLERSEERTRQQLFQQYQQKQYLEQQRLMDKQNMYNQSHQRSLNKLNHDKNQ